MNRLCISFLIMACSGCVSPPPCQNPVRAISVGSGHTLVQRANGALWSWGMNGMGQLGDGTITDQPFPGLRRGLGEVVGLAAGSQYSVAVTNSGLVYHWGRNVGPNPVALPLSGISKVASGESYSLAVGADGSVWEWGVEIDHHPARTIASPRLRPAL